MTYELRMALSQPASFSPSIGPAAAFEEIELLYQHLERVAISTGFLDPREPKRLMQRIRRLFARARLEKEEVNILRGVLGACENCMRPYEPVAKDSSVRSSAHKGGKLQES